MIGKARAVIRALTEETGTRIDISDEDVVAIASVDAAAGQEAKRRNEALTASVEVARPTTASVTAEALHRTSSEERSSDRNG